MKIKIQDSQELKDAIESVNKLAGAHTASVDCIINATKDAETQLEQLCIPAGKRSQAQFIFMSGGTVAKSYKYRRTVNIVTAVRGSKDWFVTEIRKTEIWPNQSGSIRIGLTSEQERIALSQVRSKFFVL